ncbi:MAG: hypothetical protein RLZZ601_1722 [Pseudomonadota bacterium]|jgi:integrase
MEKQNDFITELNGVKGSTFKVRIRQRCPFTGETFKISKSFKTRKQAESYKKITLAEILQGTFNQNKKGELTLADLIDLYLKELGHNFRRSKLGAYKLIKDTKLAKKRIDSLSTQDLIRHGKERQLPKFKTLKNGTVKELPGAGGSTMNAEFSYIGTVLKWAKAEQYAVNENLITESRRALEMNYLIHDGVERSRRPSQDELDRLINYFEVIRPERNIPLGILIRFAVGTGLRLGEILRLEWKELNEANKTIWIRDRKDPRQKVGKDNEIALIWQTGYDTFEILMAQKGKHPELVFPYSGDTVSSVFPRAVRRLGIEDLHFHDLRHEFCSRMVEYGWTIPKIQVNSGHKDLRSMQRYMNMVSKKLHEEKPKNWISLG